MKTKHTPGTWFVEMGDLGSYFVSSGNTFVVCQIFSNDVFDDPLPPGECKANARLIASAPVLLEACAEAYRRILSKHECYDRDECPICEALDTMNAAIQKARTDED